jgi:hypothetical protein
MPSNFTGRQKKRGKTALRFLASASRNYSFNNKKKFRAASNGDAKNISITPELNVRG